MCTGCCRTENHTAIESAGAFRRPFFWGGGADDLKTGEPGLHRQKPAGYQRSPLHAFVVGAAAAFRNDPVDDLVGVGYVAGFAVDAIGGVDF
jgi:hypothetical protein